jgi:folate-dependent phosphoribosylglycinamide formyltransferase PurN
VDNILCCESGSLEPYEVAIPDSGECTIAVLAKSSPRHRWFACRLQQALGKRVIRWYEIRDPDVGSPSAGRFSTVQSQVKVALNRLRDSNWQSFPSTFSALARRIIRSFSTGEVEKHQRRLYEAQRAVIHPDLPALLDAAHLEPQQVDDPNALSFVQELQRTKPTLLLILGGPLYRAEVFQAPSGLTINQHAGWAPHYKGTNAVYWALYRRDLRRLGSTVHIVGKGVDAGPILARSFPALTGSESPEECFLRVVILGTELMIDVVEQLCARKTITAYKQPDQVGNTYTSADVDADFFRVLRKDAEQGILSELISRNAAY